ncbi:MAG: alanine dehydrogenase [Flavobacteriaceae bacterium]|nr:alanine dehydrogenase [Flavobacteriaceae bacterium]
MKFALIKERKSPPDRRVVLSPEACQKVISAYEGTEILVESSEYRVFPDSSYKKLGLVVSDDISEADIMLGVKEVPVEALIPNKTYFIFSHTIKKQPYNRKLLQAVLEKNIDLYDHETIVNEKGFRLIGFGYYAGIAGAYNGIRAFGLKHDLFEIPKAVELEKKEKLIETLKGIELPAIKIVLTGKGRVGSGAKEILDGMGVREVDVEAYLSNDFEEAVYVNIDVLDYNERLDGKSLDMFDFFDNPGAYRSTFNRYSLVSDLFIAGHFYGEGAPLLISKEEAKTKDFKISVVADISCDVDGPVASTIRASTIEDPIYGYDPVHETEVDFRKEGAVAVMAVDNLPCEVPDNASRGFGYMFITHVMPAFFNGDKDGILGRAKITGQGKLTERFSYLQDYADGKE